MPLLNGPLPKDVQHIHILGICGTAMGALAGMLSDAGFKVTGSDTGAYPPMSDYLASLGIEIQLGYNLADQVRLGYSSEVFLLNHPIRKIRLDVESMIDEKVTEFAEAHLEGAVARQSTLSSERQ